MASWSATEDFEYSVGNLNGQNGGSGWSAAWSADAGATVVSSPTFSGTGAMKIRNTFGGTNATRSLIAGVNGGICRVYTYATNVPTGTKGFTPAIFYEGATFRFIVGWGWDASVSGNTIAISGDNVTFVTVATGMTAGAWHYIDFQFDQANNRGRASVDGGAWSSYVTANGGSFTAIDGYRVTTQDANATDQGYYIDNIGVGTGPVTAVTHNFTLLGVGV